MKTIWVPKSETTVTVREGVVAVTESMTMVQRPIVENQVDFVRIKPNTAGFNETDST